MSVRAKHLALLGVALAAFAVTPVRADCAAPTISVRPSTAAPGDLFVVAGRYFDDVCDDTGGGTCFGDNGVDSRPTQDISIGLKAKGEEISLAEADAGEDLRFTVEVRVPEDLPPGRYAVVADGAQSDVLMVKPGKHADGKDG